jgi:CIC family chloride channel protein
MLDFSKIISKNMTKGNLQIFSVGILLPAAIGLICGTEAVLIRTIIPVTFDKIMVLAGLNDKFTIIIIFASLITGLYLTSIITRHTRETSGVGLDIAIENYHSKAGIMPWNFAPLKFLATFFTLGLGGSGGLVGPTAAIGQGTASYFSRWLKLTEDKSKMLALCGIAGCISGLMNTPFGATIFALELCYMSGIIYEDLIPVLISSISAYIMSARIVGMLPFGNFLKQPYLFRTVVSDSAFPWPLHYFLYCIIAGLFTTLLGILFIKTFWAFQSFSKTRIKSIYRPAISAILIGLIATVFFRHRMIDVLGQAGESVEHSIMEDHSLNTVIAIFIGRWTTTLLTVGLGGSGGLFAPTILIGTLSGTIIARTLSLAKGRILMTTCIAAALSGVINVPIAAVIIVVEVFGVNYIIPAAIGSSIAYLMAKNLVIYPHIRPIRPI